MNPKIKTKPELKRILARLKSLGKKIVFTNGCFEIIHVGHIRCLKSAKKYGDILVVAVNTDSSVRRLKGEKRPLVPCRDRMEIISGLASVDYVVPFCELTPAKIIGELKPDVLVKGSDYNLEDIVGKETVLGYGGEVVTIPLVKNKSTTRLIEKICRSYTG